MICPKCKYDKAIQLFTSIACDRCDGRLTVSSSLPDRISQFLEKHKNHIIVLWQECVLDMGGTPVPDVPKVQMGLQSWNVCSLSGYTVYAVTGRPILSGKCKLKITAYKAFNLPYPILGEISCSGHDL